MLIMLMIKKIRLVRVAKLSDMSTYFSQLHPECKILRLTVRVSKRAEFLTKRDFVHPSVVAAMNATQILDRFEFVRQYPGVGYFLLIFLVLGAIFGTFGNALILVSVCRIINMRSLEYIFIANLALSDMYVTLLADPMNIVGRYRYIILYSVFA